MTVSLRSLSTAPLLWCARLLLASLLVAGVSAVGAGCPDVTAPVGVIRGFFDDSSATCLYTNIPYAAPPIGPLRFAPPVPLSSLPLQPFLATNRTLAQCVQLDIGGSGHMVGSEDCLYLTVSRPSAPAPPEGWPVIIWFCGGGFQQCYPQDAGGRRWVNATQSLVFVSVAYRLNAFGFFSLRELSDERGAQKLAGLSYSGNQGLQDQQAALRWLQRNVAAFGGDPGRLTLQGESAGSFSVCYQLMLPNSSGLFSAAIAESGACDGPYPAGAVTLDKQEADHRRAFVGPSPCASLQGAALLECLRGLSTSAVYALYGVASQSNPVYQPPMSLFIPVTDGVILADVPQRFFSAGHGAAVPLIVGTNAGEAVLWLWNRGPDPSPPYAYTAAQLEMQTRYDSLNNAALVDFYTVKSFAARYNITDIGRILIDEVSAQSFHCPARRLARWLAPRTAVFHYSFNYLADSSASTRWTGLAQHSAELQTFFYTGGSSREDAVMAAQMQNYLHRFLAHRSVGRADAAIDRLYSPIYGNATLPTWPRFEAAVPGGDRSMCMQSGAQHFEVRSGVHADQCDLWDGALPLPTITPRRIPPAGHLTNLPAALE